MAQSPREVLLQPGEWFVGSDCSIRTLLGSCVSIVLWHPRRRVGAMSHFVLASRGPLSTAPLDGRYGDEVLRLMLQRLGDLGVDAGECQGKLFGGGNMFPDQALAEQAGGDVGRRNGYAARLLLQRYGIAQVSESLFGVGHRQVVFDTRSGEVWVRQFDLQDSVPA